MPEIHQHIEDFEQIFARELTPQLAAVYVESLVDKLGGKNQELDQFVMRGEVWHREIGEKLFGPLLVAFNQSVEVQCSQLEHTGPVFFALRDAAPLMKAAEIAWDGSTIYPVGIYANRPLLQIEDEISPEGANVNGKMVEYLKMLGLDSLQKVVWVDTGAWGTVIKAMKLKLLQDNKFYPLFWYSHNPHIPGYINGLAKMAGIDESMGEVINDTLECVFPQVYLRPTEIVAANPGLQVVLERSNLLSRKWGNAALEGVRASAMHYKDRVVGVEEQIGALTRLVEAHNEAKQTGQCTGVLPSNTPTWSKGSEFLASWPEDLLP